MNKSTTTVLGPGSVVNRWPSPPPVSQPPAPAYEERLVTIMDATVQEDEGNDERPYVTKILWLLLQDVETNAIFRSPLTEEQVKQITGLSRQLQGRELYKFADLLKDREEPIKLIVDVNNSEVNVDMILAEGGPERSDDEIMTDFEAIGLPTPKKVAQISKFKFEPSKMKTIQDKINNE
jgi:hypothetical protein